MTDKKGQNNMRDYGLVDPVVNGTPTWKASDEACPNCGARLCHVEVDVTEPLEGVCRYLGCPACPWASPSVTMRS